MTSIIIAIDEIILKKVCTEYEYTFVFSISCLPYIKWGGCKYPVKIWNFYFIYFPQQFVFN